MKAKIENHKLLQTVMLLKFGTSTHFIGTIHKRVLSESHQSSTNVIEVQKSIQLYYEEVHNNHRVSFSCLN